MDSLWIPTDTIGMPYRCPMGALWISYRFLMDSYGFLWIRYGFHMDFQEISHGFSMDPYGCHRDPLGSPYGFAMVS